MAGRIVIIGFGGFGRETLDVIHELNLHGPMSGAGELEVVGVLADPAPNDRYLVDYGVKYLGTPAHLSELPPDVGYVIGIGDPGARRRLDEIGRAEGRFSPTVVHPSATIGRSVTLGPGTIVCSHVSITNHITIGRHVHLNLNCTVGHDTVVGDHVTVSPLVAVSGNVGIGDGAFLGSGATINPGVNIGGSAVVGSGATVLRDVEPGVTVVGVPAKPR